MSQVGFGAALRSLLEERNKVMKIRGVVIIIISSFILLLSGCATYQTYSGPARPGSDIALLKVMGERGWYVETIDGESGDWSSFPYSIPKWAEILPGDHTVVVRFGSRQSSNLQTLTLSAKSGHRYDLIPNINLGAPFQNGNNTVIR